jgi:hypothetical protein
MLRKRNRLLRTKDLIRRNAVDGKSRACPRALRAYSFLFRVRDVVPPLGFSEDKADKAREQSDPCYWSWCSGFIEHRPYTTQDIEGEALATLVVNRLRARCNRRR